MSGLNYFSNFDDSQFKQYENVDSTRLYSDPCAIQQRNEDNAQKLKFVTTNHIDLLEAKEKLNFFGIGLRDHLFVPGDRIDTYSSLLNGQGGQILTNCNVRTGFGQLPVPTTPYRGQVAHGDVLVEDSIRNNIEVRKNSCLPRESDFHNRSFAIFDDKIDIHTPQAIKSVETPQIGFELGRNGVPSRFVEKFSIRKKYSSAGTNFKPVESVHFLNINNHP